MASPVTSAQFRTDFSEFSDTTQYSDSQINYWLNWANTLLAGSTSFGSTRWGALLNTGIELFTAHHIVLEKMAQDTSNIGGWPGLNKGAITGETARISISYDSSSVINAEDGHWNITFFGTRFRELVKYVGMGPLQIGTSSPGSPPNNEGAWPGPNPFPGFFG